MDQNQTKEEEQPIKPLTSTQNHTSSPSIYPITTTTDEQLTATSSWRSSQHLLRRRRCMIFCCGLCAAITVIVGILILILSLTIFRIKDPSLTVNYINVTDFKIGIDTNNNNNLVSANLTLNANLALKNPNIVSFKFRNSTTEFYYEGHTVGVADAPSGEVAAYKTTRINVTLDVLTDRAIEAAQPVNLTGIFFGEDLNLTSYTDIPGRVNVFGIYKRNIDVAVNCTYTVEYSASGFETKKTTCVADGS